MNKQTKPVRRTLKANNPVPEQTSSPPAEAARESSRPFPIIGIGASAGGPEALELFLANVLADSGMAFVIVQHLNPHGVLHLLDPIAPRGLRLPIDFFFRALADDQQEHSMGVILSGMGSDGTLGLRAIKEKAGAVFLQENPQEVELLGAIRTVGAGGNSTRRNTCAPVGVEEK